MRVRCSQAFRLLCVSTTAFPSWRFTIVVFVHRHPRKMAGPCRRLSDETRSKLATCRHLKIMDVGRGPERGHRIHGRGRYNVRTWSYIHIKIKIQSWRRRFCAISSLMTTRRWQLVDLQDRINTSKVAPRGTNTRLLPRTSWQCPVLVSGPLRRLPMQSHR